MSDRRRKQTENVGAEPDTLPESSAAPQDENSDREGIRRARHFYRTPVGATAAVGLAVAAAWGAFHRIGTTACATDIELHQSLEGGYVAIGYSEHRPGFLLLSSLPPSRVGLEADVRRSFVAGTYTVLHMPEGTGEWSHRLRGPVLLTIDRHGKRTIDDVAWTREEFAALRTSLDCTNPSVGGKKRCGQPFADVADMLASLSPTRVPQAAVVFLASRDISLKPAPPPDDRPSEENPGAASDATTPAAERARAGASDS